MQLRQCGHGRPTIGESNCACISAAPASPPGPGVFAYRGSHPAQPAWVRAFTKLTVELLADKPAFVLAAEELKTAEIAGRAATKRHSLADACRLVTELLRQRAPASQSPPREDSLCKFCNGIAYHATLGSKTSDRFQASTRHCRRGRERQFSLQGGPRSDDARLQAPTHRDGVLLGRCSTADRRCRAITRPESFGRGLFDLSQWRAR
jgi:hypothetical protein